MEKLRRKRVEIVNELANMMRGCSVRPAVEASLHLEEASMNCELPFAFAFSFISLFCSLYISRTFYPLTELAKILNIVGLIGPSMDRYL